MDLAINIDAAIQELIHSAYPRLHKRARIIAVPKGLYWVTADGKKIELKKYVRIFHQMTNGKESSFSHSMYMGRMRQLDGSYVIVYAPETFQVIV